MQQTQWFPMFIAQLNAFRKCPDASTFYRHKNVSTKVPQAQWFPMFIAQLDAFGKCPYFLIDIIKKKCLYKNAAGHRDIYKMPTTFLETIH